MYKVYLKYRVHNSQDGMDLGVGNFNRFERGQYERKFLLDHEYLKMQLKRWIQKNLKKLCVDTAQALTTHTDRKSVVRG